ncbi:MAG: amidohydrolase family protein [Azospirillaceae bacterium]
MADVIVFENARLFDGTSAELGEGVSVAVEGDTIKEVTKGAIGGNPARRVDVAGKVLMPGLIDAHFHAIAVHPDIGRIEKMPASLLSQMSRELLENSLMRGFTTIRDAAGADYGLAMAIENGLVKGPRMHFAGKALTQTGGHGDFRPYEENTTMAVCHCCRGGATLAAIADGVDAVRKAAREELRRGATQIKIMASGGVASPSDPIWNLQYSDEEIAAAVWEARSWRKYVMAHAYMPEAIERCVIHGVRSIEHANLIDERVAGIVAEHGAYVVPTLVTYEAMNRFGKEQGLPKVSLDKLEVVIKAGLRSLEILKAAKVKTGFGTDLLGDMHAHQSREFSIRADVLTPAEVLISATSTNAALMQQEGRLGTVAPGAVADLLVVDGNPLEDVNVLEHQGRNLDVIMKGGRFYKDRLAA